MAKKKKDEMTLMREKALNSGRIVNTQRPIDSKIRSQLLKNYGLFVRKYSD